MAPYMFWSCQAMVAIGIYLLWHNLSQHEAMRIRYILINGHSLCYLTGTVSIVNWSIEPTNW